MTKAERQQKILDLIQSQNIATQTELTNMLIASGFDVTQATTSRDLQEMRIMKRKAPQGIKRMPYGC